MLRPCCALQETERERKREMRKMSSSRRHPPRPTLVTPPHARPAHPRQTNNITDFNKTHMIPLLMDSQSDSNSDLDKRCSGHLESNRGIPLPLPLLLCCALLEITRATHKYIPLMLCVFRLSAPSALLFNQFPSAIADGVGAILWRFVNHFPFQMRVCFRILFFLPFADGFL